MKKFIEKVEPVVKKFASQYKYSVPGYTYEDLLQEGFATALAAGKCWKHCPGQAGILSWAWVQIHARFKNLSKPYEYEKDEKLVSYDSLGKDIAPNDLDPFISSFFNVNVDAGMDDWGENDYAEGDADVRAKLKAFLPERKFKPFLEHMLELGLSQVSSADGMGVKPARVSQLKRVITDKMHGTMDQILSDVRHLSG